MVVCQLDTLIFDGLVLILKRCNFRSEEVQRISEAFSKGLSGLEVCQLVFYSLSLGSQLCQTVF
jgi:hypothetical protein